MYGGRVPVSLPSDTMDWDWFSVFDSVFGTMPNCLGEWLIVVSPVPGLEQLRRPKQLGWILEEARGRHLEYSPCAGRAALDRLSGTSSPQSEYKANALETGRNYTTG